MINSVGTEEMTKTWESPGFHTENKPLVPRVDWDGAELYTTEDRHS